MSIGVRSDIKWITSGGDAYYNVNTNQIEINSSQFVSNNPIVLLELIHEARHAYQREAVDNPSKHMVTAGTLEEWEYNLAHYINLLANESNKAEYVAQPIEFDANCFAGLVVLVNEALVAHMSGSVNIYFGTWTGYIP